MQDYARHIQIRILLINFVKIEEPYLTLNILRRGWNHLYRYIKLRAYHKPYHYFFLHLDRLQENVLSLLEQSGKWQMSFFLGKNKSMHSGKTILILKIRTYSVMSFDNRRGYLKLGPPWKMQKICLPDPQAEGSELLIMTEFVRVVRMSHWSWFLIRLWAVAVARTNALSLSLAVIVALELMCGQHFTVYKTH